MRFGCCLNMTARPGDPTGIGDAGTAALAGFDYIELPLAQISELSPAEFDRLAALASHSPIPCEVCNNAVPPYVRLTGPEANPSRITAFFEEALRRASVLGAKFVGIGSPGARNVPQGFSRERAIEQLAAAFRIAGDIGQKCGLGINIEPVNKADSNILNEVDECVEFHRLVNHDNVGLMIDYYHLGLDGEPVGNILKMKGKIAHAHIASLTLRRFPMKGDADDYQAFAAMLTGAGYDGRLSIEANSDDLGGDMRRSIELLREIF